MIPVDPLLTYLYSYDGGERALLFIRVDDVRVECRWFVFSRELPELENGGGDRWSHNRRSYFLAPTLHEIQCRKAVNR